MFVAFSEYMNFVWKEEKQDLNSSRQRFFFIILPRFISILQVRYGGIPSILVSDWPLSKHIMK